MKNPHSNAIKNWAEEDRPREKLRDKGKYALTEAELIAILIGSGNADVSAVELSRQILASVGNDLHELAKLSTNDLMKFKGIGEAKAISIVSALELGRRRKESEYKGKPQISGSRDVYNYFKQFLLDLKHEEFWILLLNKRNVIIKEVRISSGGVSGTFTDSKLIFKHALENLATSLILVHNHPSGNKNASQQDKSITKGLVAAGKILEINVTDHIIFTDNGYFSLADAGMM
ncbi:DNA repair protein RadC [Emticicia sp. CRIBPO]|uniref:RadC family protein n=1 Tax=Emticicia sp. CRIBPO TaxID=2683258 RepID=UPI001413725F|nr:DNA repair protein RadC [Emticicia sp. CRIBPO]NBA88542.1 DNA repair protein RadC [Emticicia sp. CRIBPO]